MKELLQAAAHKPTPQQPDGQQNKHTNAQANRQACEHGEGAERMRQLASHAAGCMWAGLSFTMASTGPVACASAWFSQPRSPRAQNASPAQPPALACDGACSAHAELPALARMGAGQRNAAIARPVVRSTRRTTCKSTSKNATSVMPAWLPRAHSVAGHPRGHSLLRCAAERDEVHLRGGDGGGRGDDSAEGCASDGRAVLGDAPAVSESTPSAAEYCFSYHRIPVCHWMPLKCARAQS